MSGVIHDTQNDFWRPPAAERLGPSSISHISRVMGDACSHCETEFMVGARFCYVCGAARPTQAGSAFAPSWTRYLEFHYIKQALGLSVVPLVAFMLGLGCLLAAFLLGVFYDAQSYSDFQAVQLWRMQWLLAAITFFVAGILLKRPDSRTNKSGH